MRRLQEGKKKNIKKYSTSLQALLLCRVCCPDPTYPIPETPSVRTYRRFSLRDPTPLHHTDPIHNVKKRQEDSPHSIDSAGIETESNNAHYQPFHHNHNHNRSLDTASIPAARRIPRTYLDQNYFANFKARPVHRRGLPCPWRTVSQASSSQAPAQTLPPLAEGIQGEEGGWSWTRRCGSSSMRV